MRWAQRLELRAQPRIHRHRLGLSRIDVQMHLLAARDQDIVPPTVEAMKNVQALIVDSENLRGRIQSLADLRFSEVLHMALGGIEHASVTPGGGVYADAAVERVH